MGYGVMVIGIGGVSRAGKSTLTDLLAKQLKAKGYSVKTVHQDDLVREESELTMIRDRYDWELPSTVRHDQVLDVVGSAIQGYDVVIVDGLFAFYDERLSSLMTDKIYVEVSKEVFLKRKREDLRWGGVVEPEWYILHIWTSHWLYGRPSEEDLVMKVSGESYFDLHDIMDQLSWRR